MNRIRVLIPALGIFIVVISAVVFLLSRRAPPSAVPDSVPTPQPTSFFILSQAFTDGETIPAKYTCDGQDINPPLTIGNIPEGTKSLALVIDDIDTPSGTWIHWLVWNIEPAAYLDIGENTTPAGSTTGRNGFGKSAYGGPCPPDRAHRYVFSVYALDRHLILPAGSGKQDVLNAANTRILGSARITGLYVRPRR